MVFQPVVQAFSLSHAMVMDGATSFLDAMVDASLDLDVYGVNESSLEPDTDEYDVEGDDAVLDQWSWLNKADLTVQAGYLSFPLIAQLTRRPIESSTFGGKNVFGMDLWHEDSLNVPPRPALLRMPARDLDGNAATLVMGLYRVNFKPIMFDGPQYKEGLKVNYNGTATYSRKDELGNVFADGKRRVGRLLAIEI